MQAEGGTHPSVLPGQFGDLGPVLFAGTIDDHLGEAGLWHLGDDFMPPRVEALILEVVVGVEEHGMNDECTMTNVEWQSARIRHFHAVTAQKSPHTPSGMRGLKKRSNVNCCQS
jgi:hypothetical protein